LITQQKRSSKWITIGLFITTYFAVGAVAPYVALYFQGLGMSLDGIGLLAAALALCAVIASPVWGALADQSLGSRAAMILSLLGSVALVAVVGVTDVLVVAVVFALLYQVAAAGIGPILDAFTLDQVADNRNRYGLFRAWGSAAFVVGAVAVGVLIDATSLRAFFVPLVVSLLIAAVLALAIPARTTNRASRSWAGMGEVIRSRPMAAFLVASLVVWSANAMVNNFFPIYLESLKAPAALVGSAFAIGAIVEVPVMVAFPFLAARFGMNRIVVVGSIAFLLRILVLVFTSDASVAAAAMVLHGVGYALLLVGGVTYVAALAPSGRAATAQGVFAAVIAGLAQALGPAAGGIIAGASSIPAMFAVAAVVSAAGVVAIWFAVTRERPATPPTPIADVAEAAPSTAA
jgi:MFS transporter, PPP family, 3-phenylpropionic acid transporter